MRTLYGLSASDFTVTKWGAVAPNARVAIFDAREGGQQVTDLLSLEGDPITEAQSDTEGVVGFYGPEGFAGNLWASSGTQRLLMRPVVETAEELTALAFAIAKVAKVAEAALPASGGTVTGKVTLGERTAIHPTSGALVILDGELPENFRSEGSLVFGSLNGGATGLTNSVSLVSGSGNTYGSNISVVPVVGQSHSGPWDTDRQYLVWATSGLTLDGEPVPSNSLEFQPTRSDHVVTATAGLKVRRSPVPSQRDGAVQIGLDARASTNGVAVGSGAVAAETSGVAAGTLAVAFAKHSIALGSGARAMKDDVIVGGRGVIGDDPAIVRWGTPGVARRMFVGSNELLPIAAIKAAAATATDFADFQARIAAL